MKQHAATWAPDDFKPRKGPHKTAPSRPLVQRSLPMWAYPGTLSVRARHVPITVTLDDGREWSLPPLQYVDIEIGAPRQLRISGRRGAEWARVQNTTNCGKVLLYAVDIVCPSMEARHAPSRPSPLLEAAGFRVTRRPLANLASAEQALSR